jgi:magnesium transporter
MNKNKKRKKAGLPPGTVVFTGEKKGENIDLVYVRYGLEGVEERFYTNELPSLMPAIHENVAWYDLRGLDNVSILQDFGTAFDIHPLILEDIANVGQRPKFEEYDNGIFIVAQAFRFKSLDLTFQTEQVSFYVGKNYVISFQEDSEDLFAFIREQIKVGKSRICHKKSDYLAYILVDFIVDQYLEILDQVEEKIEHLEIEVSSSPTPRVKSQLYQLKRELNGFKKNVFLLREAIGRWTRTEVDLVEPTTIVYLRDLLDHVNLTLERSESFRDVLTDLQGLYISELSAKANSVINLLTIISTIFIPLTFIVGVYGMNFDNMPELHSPNGYYVVWALMGTIAIGLVLFFKHRKWL